MRCYQLHGAGPLSVLNDMNNHSRKPGFYWILCLILSSMSGCTLVSDEYGVCVPEDGNIQGAVPPRGAFAAPINPPAAVVCYPEGATDASSRSGNRGDERETGLAITSDADAVSVFAARNAEGETTDFRISACLDLDLCGLEVHGRIKFTASTQWGSSVCGSTDFGIDDCSCDDSSCDDIACDQVTARDDSEAAKMYFFVSANGRDFEYIDSFSPSVDGTSTESRGGRDIRSIAVDTEQRAYRFVRICRPERSHLHPHTTINHVRIDG